MTDRATLPDYSYWNGACNFQKAKDNGAPGVILRASWGMYADTMFETYRNQCDAIDLPWAAYHYYDFRWSLDTNLAAFKNALAGRFGFQAIMDLEQDPSTYQMKAARALLANENPEQALDVMPFTRQTIGATVQPVHYAVSRPAAYTLVPTQVQSITWSFLSQVKTLIGKSPWLYTGFFYWSTWGTSEAKWAEFPLWEAWYTTNEASVKIPAPWTVKTAWQYTGNGSGPDWGSSGLSQDLSLYYSSVDQFNDDMNIDEPIVAHDLSVHAPHYCAICGAPLVDLDPVPVPPEPPIPPAYQAYKVKSGNHPTVRSGDGREYLPWGYLIDDGATIYVDSTDAQTGYCHIQPAWGYDNFGVKKYFDTGGWVWMGYLIKL